MIQIGKSMGLPYLTLDDTFHFLQPNNFILPLTRSIEELNYSTDYETRIMILCISGIIYARISDIQYSCCLDDTIGYNRIELRRI